MDKTPRERRLGARALLAALLGAVAILGAVLGTLAATGGRQTNTAAGPRLQTATIVRTTLSVTAGFNGTLGFTTGRTISDPAGGTLTALPAAGSTVARGEPLFWVDDQPVIAFYGTTALFRTLRSPAASTRPGTVANGPSTAVLTALQSLQSAQQQVSADRLTLHQDLLQRDSSGRATLLGAEAQLSADRAALAAARAELAADQRLGCPAASSATVGSPSTQSVSSTQSAPPATSAGTGSSGLRGTAKRAHDAGGVLAATQAAGSGTTAADSTATATTSTGAPSVPLAPAVTGEQDSGETTTTVLLAGQVTPGGSDTVYHFIYGTTAALSSSTPSGDAGTGDTPVPVSAQLTGLRPDTTYVYALVAQNAHGSATGVTESFTTAPSSCAQQRGTIAADLQTVTQDLLTARGDRASVADPLQTARNQLRADLATVRADTQALRRAQLSVTRPSSTEMRGQDVALVAQNLAALGYYSGPTAGADLAYTPALAAAVRRWQAAAGITPTGQLAPAQVVVLAGPARIAAVHGTVGAHANAPIVSLSGTTKVISFGGSGALRPGQVVQVSAAGGAPVSGRITAVTPRGNALLARATVTQPAGLPSSGPVSVVVTTQSRPHVLAVPVETLLARPSGGYALQLPDGQQLPVKVGLIAGDSAEVSGPGLRPGMRVVTAT